MPRPSITLQSLSNHQERDALARELDKTRRELTAQKEESTANRKQRDLLQAELASTRAAYIEHLDARRQIDDLTAALAEAREALQVSSGERDAAVLTKQLAEQEAKEKVAKAQAEVAHATADLSVARAELISVSVALEEATQRADEADAKAKEASEQRGNALAAQAAAEAHTAAALHDVEMEQEARARVEQESLEFKDKAAQAVRKRPWKRSGCSTLSCSPLCPAGPSALRCALI